MREGGAFEAKNKLSDLVDEVAHGGEIIITRRGKQVARLVAPAAVDRDSAKAAADRILTRSKGVTLGDLSIRGLIEEGRR